MDFTRFFLLLVLLFIGVVGDSISDIKSDELDEFNIFVQSFLAHLLNSDAFSKSEKEDLKAIVDTVETVITAPRRRETDILRKMQIFNVAVVTSIAETIGADTTESPTNTKRKAHAIAWALRSAFNTVSSDSSNNQQLISEVSSMVNMFSRLEEQESLEADLLSTLAVGDPTVTTELTSDFTSPNSLNQNQPTNLNMRPPVTPYNNLGNGNVNANNYPVKQSPLNVNPTNVPVDNTSPVSFIPQQYPPNVPPTEEQKNAKVNKESTSTTNPPGSINWNFIFCLYNELFSSKLFTTAFASNLPYNEAMLFTQRISKSLSAAFFYGRLSEYEISSTLSQALLYLNTVPTTEEFAYMFGNELSKMIYNTGMFQGNDPCKLSASAAAAILKSLENPSNKLNDKNTPPQNNASDGNKPPLPYLMNSPTKGGMKAPRQVDFELKLKNSLLSSEIFYTAFPKEVLSDKLSHYAFSIGSFIPATPEYKSIDISRLSSALTENLQAIKTPALAEKFANAIVSAVSVFIENSGLLTNNNIDKQASRVGAIILNALCTQITTNFHVCTRRHSESRMIPKKPLTQTANNKPYPLSNGEKTKFPFPKKTFNKSASNPMIATVPKQNQLEDSAKTNDASNREGEQKSTLTDPTTSENNVTETYNVTDSVNTEYTNGANILSNQPTKITGSTDVAGNSDIYTTEMSDSGFDKTSEFSNTDSSTEGYDNSTSTDDCSSPTEKLSGNFGSLTTPQDTKETFVKKLTEDIHQAERSGTTESLARMLTEIAISSTIQSRLESTKNDINTESTVTGTLNTSALKGITSDSTGTEVSEMSNPNTAEYGTTGSSIPETTTSNLKDSTSTTTDENNSEYLSNSSSAPEKVPKAKLLNSPNNDKDESQQPKPSTWLFENALSYSLISSDKFVSLFKPDTTSSDAKSFSFTMAEAVAELPSYNFSDNVFRFGHSFYSAAQQVQPKATAEEYAKAFANATAKLVSEEDLLTKQNQISLAIETGNTMHDSLQDEKPRNPHKAIRDIPKPFEHEEDDDSVSNFLEDLLSTLTKSDPETKQNLLSQTLSDIGVIIGNKQLQPRTLLIKLLMEGLVAAVNVIISENNE